MINAKTLLQKLLEIKLDWDESIPHCLETDWQNFKVELSQVDTINVPRFELCASHLLAKLWCMVKPKLEKYTIESINFWGDSEIVLHWLKTHQSALHTFVSNRVAEIQEKTSDAIWRYVPSAQNPAYIVSRGCNIDEIKSSIWFTGPDFLQKSATEWPKNINFELSSYNLSLEKKKTVDAVLLLEKVENGILELMVKKS